MGPYQYTAGPDYTALPIERTEFLETVLPRYAGGFEAGAHGVMMSFVALNGVPAHADPFLRDLVKARAGPGAIIESDYDGDLRALRRLRLCREPEGGGAPRLHRGRRPHRPLLAPLPPAPARARRGGPHPRGGPPRPRRRDAAAEGAASASSTTRCSGTAPDREAGAPRRPDRPPTATSPAPRSSCCARSGPTRPCCRSRPRPTSASASSARSRTRIPRTGSAPTPATPTATSSGSRPRSPASASRWPEARLRPRLRLRRSTDDRRRCRSCARRPKARRAARRTSCSSSASRTMERRVRRRWPSRGCRCSSAGWSSPCAAPTRGEARRLRHRRPGAAHPARGRGERRRPLLDRPARHLRRRRHRRHPRRGLHPDRPPLARPADRRRHHLGLRHAPGAHRPAGGAGGARARPRGASATTGAPTTSASAPAGRRPTTSARAIPTPPSRSPTGRSTAARSRSRPAAPSPPASASPTPAARAGTETVHLYYQDMVCEERVPRLLERLGHLQVDARSRRVGDARASR